MDQNSCTDMLDTWVLHGSYILVHWSLGMCYGGAWSLFGMAVPVGLLMALGLGR